MSNTIEKITNSLKSLNKNCAALQVEQRKLKETVDRLPVLESEFAAFRKKVDINDDAQLKKLGVMRERIELHREFLANNPDFLTESIQQVNDSLDALNSALQAAATEEKESLALEVEKALLPYTGSGATAAAAGMSIYQGREVAKTLPIMHAVDAGIASLGKPFADLSASASRDAGVAAIEILDRAKGSIAVAEAYLKAGRFAKYLN